MVLEKSTQPNIVILTGPTATGKTAIAIEFAKQLYQKTGKRLEIINADSLLFYKGLDIGTAKPRVAEMSDVPHHLIDIVQPDAPFNAGDFHSAVTERLEQLSIENKSAFIVGGSGFYLKSLLYGIWESPKSDPLVREKLELLSTNELFLELLEKDPERAKKTGPNDRYRLVRALEIIKQSGKTPTELERQKQIEQRDPRYFLCVIDRNSTELDARILERTRSMVPEFIVEVQELLKKYPGHLRPLQSVGYLQVQNYLQGILPSGRKLAPGLPGLIDEIALATRQLVKSQRTWFRAELKRNSASKLFELDQDSELLLQTLFQIYNAP